MKTATITLWLDKWTNLTKHNVTPAEVQLLCLEHKKNAGRVPVENIRDIKDTEVFVATEFVEKENGKREAVEHKRPWTTLFEKRRLKEIYGTKKVAALFPINSTLPPTYEDAIASVLESDEEEVEQTLIQKKGPQGATLFAHTSEGLVNATADELAALAEKGAVTA